jgi:hypothetical protein
MSVPILIVNLKTFEGRIKWKRIDHIDLVKMFLLLQMVKIRQIVIYQSDMATKILNASIAS